MNSTIDDSVIDYINYPETVLNAVLINKDYTLLHKLDYIDPTNIILKYNFGENLSIINSLFSTIPQEWLDEDFDLTNLGEILSFSKVQTLIIPTLNDAYIPNKDVCEICEFPFVFNTEFESLSTSSPFEDFSDIVAAYRKIYPDGIILPFILPQMLVLAIIINNLRDLDIYITLNDLNKCEIGCEMENLTNIKSIVQQIYLNHNGNIKYLLVALQKLITEKTSKISLLLRELTDGYNEEFPYYNDIILAREKIPLWFEKSKSCSFTFNELMNLLCTVNGSNILIPNKLCKPDIILFVQTIRYIRGFRLDVRDKYITCNTPDFIDLVDGNYTSNFKFKFIKTLQELDLFNPKINTSLYTGDDVGFLWHMVINYPQFICQYVAVYILNDLNIFPDVNKCLLLDYIKKYSMSNAKLVVFNTPIYKNTEPRIIPIPPYTKIYIDAMKSKILLVHDINTCIEMALNDNTSESISYFIYNELYKIYKNTGILTKLFYYACCVQSKYSTVHINLDEIDTLPA